MDDWVNVISVASDVVRILMFARLVGKLFFAKKKRPDSE